ncbi:response regulator transcription factor [Actinophytocola oryzae]|uniref:DNA-binding response OmpR family regulator n=1 Tax=Actinophytocola oryzae TaxID=502181 RepID=A0A4R7W029_9PSEU|nr:response regulator transcription factor [Actinophytocola oryzae]TDV54877.1 DNA-binding response OmpR family regulator [Actinophytocola oryzae]
MPHTTRLLLVEDDPVIGRVLDAALRRDGYDVRWHPSGGDAVRDAAAREFELALVDLGLPDVDGLAVCQRLRELRPSCVVVVLTARDEEVDIIVGLESGADDYLTKPVRLGELRARIRAHLRRWLSVPVVRGPLRVGDLRLDLPARRAAVGERVLPLRAKEFDLLARLAATPGVAVRRETLMSDVWDTRWYGPTKTLDVHVASVRRKLAEAGGDRVPSIATVRGHGYRLEPAD